MVLFSYLVITLKLDMFILKMILNLTCVTYGRGCLFYIPANGIKHTDTQASSRVRVLYPNTWSSCRFLCGINYKLFLPMFLCTLTQLKPNKFGIHGILFAIFLDFEAYALCRRLLYCPKINTMQNDDNNSMTMITRHTNTCTHPTYIKHVVPH